MNFDMSGMSCMGSAPGPLEETVEIWHEGTQQWVPVKKRLYDRAVTQQKDALAQEVAKGNMTVEDAKAIITESAPQVRTGGLAKLAVPAALAAIAWAFLG